MKLARFARRSELSVVSSGFPGVGSADTYYSELITRDILTGGEAL